MYRNLFFLLILFTACQSPTPPAGSGQPAVAGVHFQFSTAASQSGLQDESNWCSHKFQEAVRIDAAAGNSNRRFFALGSGVHHVVVDAGGPSASFMLRKGAGQSIELFTSANYPLCLSDRNHFTIKTDNGSLAYNDDRHIQFSAQLAEQNGGYVVILEMAPEAGYGFQVHRCADCQ